MPSRPLARAVALAAALLAAGGLVIAAPAAAAPHRTGRSIAAAALHHRATVLLPTGDAVSVDPSRPKDLRVRTRTASGLGHGWRAFTSRGHTYVVPLVATPFVGTVLDPSLFDVTALARAGAKPRVSVAVAHGTKAAVPGLTVTSRTKGAQRGYFTPKGAARFGAALQRAAVASRGRSAATRSLFGAASIRVGSAVSVITPQYPQQTVVFRARGGDGKPLPDGFLFYGNLDQAARATGFAFILDGEVRVSLPKGSYTLYSDALRFTSDTTAEERVVTQPQLQVTGKKNQVVGIDFRTATAQPSLTVPQPTSAKDFTIAYDREWKDAGFVGFTGGDASTVFRIAPAPAPTIGTASLVSLLRATPTSGAAELYAAAFQQDGAISVDQSHVLAAGQLGDVHERVFATGAPNAAAFVQGVQLPNGIGIGTGDPIALPLERLDHFAAPSGAFWSNAVVTAPTELDPFDGEVDGGLRAYAPGTSRTEDWLRQTVAPAVPTFTDEELAQGVPCLACRTAKQLVVATAPLTDSSGSGHSGAILDDATGEPAAHARLYRDGTLLDDEDGSGAVAAPVHTGAADYRVVVESTPVLAGFHYGTIARTEWTFRSSSTSGTPLAAGQGCAADGPGTCRVLPLLRVVAPLPTGLDGRMPLGANPFRLCVSGIQGASVGSTAATVQVTYDDGRTFVDVPVTAAADGCSTVALDNPASATGRFATIRITGTSRSGSTVVETVRNAYRVAG